MKYFYRTPWWLKKLFPSRTWHINTGEKSIYLTFDDGPHPVATPFVLGELKKYNAKASFFCIGKNVQAYPVLYDSIISNGHVTGNHTQHHLNGFKTRDAEYISDVKEAGKHIASVLFRPPYGRLRSSQAKKLKEFRIVMWDVLSGDFDLDIPARKCADRVIKNAKRGSIVVFHESDKALEKLQYALPLVLEEMSAMGYEFKSIPVEKGRS